MTMECSHLPGRVEPCHAHICTSVVQFCSRYADELAAILRGRKGRKGRSEVEGDLRGRGMGKGWGWEGTGGG